MSSLSKKSAQNLLSIFSTLLISNFVIAETHGPAAEQKQIEQTQTTEIEIDRLNQSFQESVRNLRPQADSEAFRIIQELNQSKENTIIRDAADAELKRLQILLSEEELRTLTEKIKISNQKRLIQLGLSPNLKKLENQTTIQKPTQEDFEKAWQALKEELAFLNDKYADKIKPLKETLFKMFAPPKSSSDPSTEKRPTERLPEVELSKYPPKHGAALPDVTPLEKISDSSLSKKYPFGPIPVPSTASDGESFKSE